MLYKVIVIFILLTCVLLALIVLIQNSKGGGLAANFSSQNQIMGVRKTADFLEKATWVLAVILVVLSFAATVAIPRGANVNEDGGLKTEVSTDNVSVPVSAVPMPQTQPATQE